MDYFRFVTGTDFVASMGPANEYPGLKAKPSGCMKDKKNHARQQTDTSTINMFFNDEAFKKIVLGENYFRINRLTDFTPPPVCGDTVSILFQDTKIPNSSDKNKQQKYKLIIENLL